MESWRHIGLDFFSMKFFPFRIFAASFLLAGFAFGQSFTGVTMDMGILKSDKNKGNTTVKMNRVDMRFDYKAHGSKAKLKVNLVEVGQRDEINTGTAPGNKLEATLEDAWVESHIYGIFSIKGGFEDAYWVHSGANSDIWEGVRQDPVRNFPKMEISGKTADIHFGVMFYEDISAVTDETEGKADSDGVIGTNLASTISYKVASGIKLGAIYRIDKDDANAEPAVDKNSYSVFGSFKKGSFRVYAKLAQLNRSSEDEGESAKVAGLNYQVMRKVKLLGSFITSPKGKREDGSVSEQIITDIAAKYYPRANIALYVQRVHFGEFVNEEGSDELGYSLLALGLETSF